MLRREVSATQHRLVMVASYLPQNGPKTQKFDFLAWTPIKNENETSFQISASRLSKWRLRFLWRIFLRLDSVLACSVTVIAYQLIRLVIKDARKASIITYRFLVFEASFVPFGFF